MRLPKRAWLALTSVVLLLPLQSCTHFAVDDCGGEVLGKQQARIRSSHWRMLLSDVPAAAARFLPYAAMSALAYAEDKDCGNREQKLEKHERTALEGLLGEAGWREVRDVAWVPPQEVRFQNKKTHSMNELAFYLLHEARSKSASEYANPWYSGEGRVIGTSETCTAAFAKAQQTSCRVKVSQDRWDPCPQ